MVQAMFMTLMQVGTTALLMALTCGGLCLPGRSSNKIENRPAEKADKMFPDGREHDFGNVIRGLPCTHSFRIVNTHNVPLKIVELRIS